MIKRSIKNRIVNSLKLKEVTIITGARQIGKTTILKEIIADLRSQANKVLYFNLDIEEDSKHFSSQQQFLNKIELEVGRDKAFVFIDEIQQKEDAGRFLKGIYDMGLPYKFIVTGSGSIELKEKISEALTGRKYLIEMKPVSFEEFVNYKTQYKYTKRLDKYFYIEKEQSQLFLNEYIMYGGYPAVVTADTIARKQEIMNEVFTSYVTKDISFLLGVRYPDKFVKLIKLLAVQSGGIIHYSQLANDVGIRTETLKTFLWYAEQTYIIKIVKPYFTNSKKELTKSITIYFNDLGMLNFSRNSFMGELNSGMVFQNFVYQVLENRFSKGLQRINYWRTKDKAEVDFIIPTQTGVVPVEVKYRELKKMEITRSFRSFISAYKPKNAYVINLGYEGFEKVNETKVHIIPFWQLFSIEI